MNCPRPQTSANLFSVDRLHCFGHFDLQDSVCFNCCALAITCVIIKNNFLKNEIPEEDPASIMPLNWIDFV
ncbi:MAG: hypothetical protein LBP22_01925 [Deltaproteobacteria bacterium]|jgi:hypothetical protein|nr:hypothetical protein [Deltaproteobacteria bacterium]